MTAGVVRVRVLGELHVEAPGGYVRAAELPGRQGRLVLAKLAMSHFPVSRDELGAIVWPDRLPKSWERDLSAVVSKIRSLLAGVGVADAVANAFGCYQLRLGDWRLDVDEASEALEEAEALLAAGDVARAAPNADVAVELLRRPFFPGEDGEWIADRRAEIDELLYRALLVAAELHAARGMFPEATRYARHLVELDPFREAGHAAVVRVLLAAGDRASALQAYEDARVQLVEALGVPPGAALEAAFQLALAADPDPSPAELPTGIVALLFTDLVGSVALAERLGPAGAEALRVEHFALLRDAIRTHRGREVKNLGDGVMAVFRSSADAVDAALAIQERAAGRARTGAEPLAIRIGVHVGEPVLEDGDYFGHAVAVARRLCDVADGGEIVVSDLVRALSRFPERFTDERRTTLKGMADPTTTWRASRPEPTPGGSSRLPPGTARDGGP